MSRQKPKKAAGALKRAPDAKASLSELLAQLKDLHRQSQEKFDQIDIILADLQTDDRPSPDMYLLHLDDLAEAAGLDERSVRRILARNPKLKRLGQSGRIVVDFAEFQSVR